jgi:hypothetical protein
MHWTSSLDLESLLGGRKSKILPEASLRLFSIVLDLHGV